jgi:hypothetical protein
MPFEIIPNTDWIFAGRFVIYVLALVLIWGSVIDWISYASQKGPRPVWSYHALVLSGSLATVLTSPDRFRVLQHLLKTTFTQGEIDVLLFLGLIFSATAFVFAQVTRAAHRGATSRKIRRGVWLSILGIVILAAVGIGLDVRFR